jgi:hypothetical protein
MNFVEAYCWAIAHAAEQFRFHSVGSSDINWTLSYIHTYLTICILKTNLRRIPLTPGFPENNYCIIQKVPIYIYIRNKYGSLPNAQI